MVLKPGERFQGRYEVVERIGEGAFATVYRAKNPEGREVALKVLKEHYVTVPDVVERFQREVFAVASISSPHVVALSDFGISDDEFFMVMELVRGPSLRELITTRQWSAAEVHTIVGQVAHALAAAHKQGIVHRDLKPENVVLVERASGWQVKVLDFGFAKLAELERRLELEPITRAGFCFGTPQYLSPEQIRGRAIDDGADLFALGVITYEMLAGRRPWDGSDAREVMISVLKSPPPAVTRMHASVMGRIEEVNRFLDRALAKERAERPPDATAFFTELGRALFSEAPPELTGATPEKRLEGVTSRSIALRLRGDETEVNPGEDDRKTIPFVTAIADPGSDIPIFVAGDGARAQRFASGWHPSLEEAHGRDSQRSTLPRPATDRPRSSAGRVLALVLLIAAVAAVAFWLGRTMR